MLDGFDYILIHTAVQVKTITLRFNANYYFVTKYLEETGSAFLKNAREQVHRQFRCTTVLSFAKSTDMYCSNGRYQDVLKFPYTVDG